MKYCLILVSIFFIAGCLGSKYESASGVVVQTPDPLINTSKDEIELASCMASLKNRALSIKLGSQSRVKDLFYKPDLEEVIGYPTTLERYMSRGVVSINYAEIESLGFVPIPNVRDEVEASYYFEFNFMGDEFPGSLLVWAGSTSGKCYFLETK
ncbi:hypothetical protein [Microbulbifer sp. HZ11]|uniref:hypothetical protein n=1 Tax=Microbulbifer sp. HZ11 TaxID=1453501 RepID=UPI0012DBFE5D|nr:hypothetical protein [Microbulbifer sp. HZ11]